MIERLKQWWLTQPFHPLENRYRDGFNDGAYCGELWERRRVIRVIETVLDMDGQFHVSDTKALARFLAEEIRKGKQA